MSKGSSGKSGSASEGKLPKKSVAHVKGGNKFANLKPSSSGRTKSY